MNVTISDQAKAIAYIEEEKQLLYAEAFAISTEQALCVHSFKQSMEQLSQRQRNIMKMMIALDDALAKLLIER